SVELLEPRLEEMKKYLSKHRHQYSRADERFETALKELSETLKEYYELTNSGNYMEGTEIVENVKGRIDTLEAELEEFPSLYKKCKQELPLQLEELIKGLAEMKQQGYAVEKFDLKDEIHNYQSRLLDMVKELENQGADNVRASIEEMETRITEMYD